MFFFLIFVRLFGFVNFAKHHSHEKIAHIRRTRSVDLSQVYYNFLVSPRISLVGHFFLRMLHNITLFYWYLNAVVFVTLVCRCVNLLAYFYLPPLGQHCKETAQIRKGRAMQIITPAPGIEPTLVWGCALQTFLFGYIVTIKSI